MRAEQPHHNLTDDDLESEIELVGELVAAATATDHRLPQAEIDRLLGVAASGEDATDAGCDDSKGRPQPGC